MDPVLAYVDAVWAGRAAAPVLRFGGRLSDRSDETNPLCSWIGVGDRPAESLKSRNRDNAKSTERASLSATVMPAKRSQAPAVIDSTPRPSMSPATVALACTATSRCAST